MFFSLRLGVQSLTRERGRTLAVVVGGLLAVALISGANLSVDFATDQLLSIALNKTPVDVTVEIADVVGPDMSSNLSDLDDVSLATPITVIGAWISVDTPPAKREGGRWVDIFGIEPEFSLFSERWGIKGIEGIRHIGNTGNTGQHFWELEENEMLLTRPSLNWLNESLPGLSTGDEINLHILVSGGTADVWVPYTLKLGGEITTPTRTIRVTEPDVGLFTRGIVVSTQTAQHISKLVHQQKSLTPGSTAEKEVKTETVQESVLYALLVDREKLVVPTNPDETRNNFRSLTRAIKITLPDPTVRISAPLRESYEDYFHRLEETRNLMIMGSIPIMALGIYLVMTGLEVGFGDKKKQIASLLSRGATNWQIGGMLFTETIILGAFIGLGGLLTGSLVFSLLTISLADQLISPTLPNLMKEGLSPPSILVSVILGIAIMTLASIRSFRRISRVQITEVLARYSPLIEEDTYNPRTDLLLVTVPLVVFLALLLSPSYLGGSMLLAFILSTITSIGFVILPLTPFMMILGATRLLTRGTTRTYLFFSRALRPLVGRTHHLIVRNLAAFPRNSSRIITLIAMSLAFTTFILMYTPTENKLQSYMTQLITGADLKISNPGSLQQPGLLSIRRVIGVEEASLITEYTIVTTEGEIGIFTLDPEEYARCVSRNHFSTNRLERLLDQLLEKRDGALVSQSPGNMPAQSEVVSLPFGWVEGNTTHTRQVDFTVLGFFKHAPGIPDTAYTRSDDGYSLIARSEYLEEQLPEIRGEGKQAILVQKREDTGLQVLIDRIMERNPEMMTRTGPYIPYVWHEESELTEVFGPSLGILGGALSSYMPIQAGFIVTMTTIGLGLIIYTSGKERLRETAGLIARGMSKEQVSKIRVGEAISLTVPGIVIGIIIGSLTLLSLAYIAVEGGGLRLPIPVILPPTLLLILVFTITSTVAAALLCSVNTRNTVLSEVLRNR